MNLVERVIFTERTVNKIVKVNSSPLMTSGYYPGYPRVQDSAKKLRLSYFSRLYH